MNRHFSTIVLIVFTNASMYAQMPPPPGGAPGGFPIPGIVYALIVAVGYGVYKHFNKSKK